MLKNAFDLLHQVTVVSVDLGPADYIIESLAEKLHLRRWLVVNHRLVGGHLVLVDEVASLERLLEAETASHRNISVHVEEL